MKLCRVDCPFAREYCATSGAECVAKSVVEQALRRYFGYQSFRPGQLEALLPVLHGHDVFVRMRTGGGKSICMFLPPLAISNTAVGIR